MAQSVKLEFRTLEEKEAYIAKRIEEARKKKLNRKFEYCPACKGGVSTRKRLMVHLRKCCQDLLSEFKLSDPDDSEKFMEFMTVIAEKEKNLRSRALFLRYMDPSMDRRRTVEEVAEEMGLPLDRTERMIKLASREIPLAKDYEKVDVLYEDEVILAVQKPPYIITSPKHRFQGGTLYSRVHGYLEKEPYGVHRLDMNTSGVVVFAKNPKIAEKINAQFREKTVRKKYLAICLGVPEEEEFDVEVGIDTDPDHDVARIVTTESGKWSKTCFRVLDSTRSVSLMDDRIGTGSNFSVTASVTGACLLLCAPLTGRTHQIRLHCAHKGHSIVGDDIYGITGDWIGRQALHAFEIEFRHPETQETIKIRAPPPEDFSKALEMLNLKLSTVM